MSAKLAQCRKLVHRAAAAGAKTVRLVQSLGESEFVVDLQREAQQAGLHINAGIHELTTGERVKNSSI
ncbi:hypothetical protein GB937_009256 [Aspergillus fischeri]|nr:hypothetical protein GB937_009256 [Aspergillus fischeri]